MALPLKEGAYVGTSNSCLVDVASWPITSIRGLIETVAIKG